MPPEIAQTEVMPKVEDLLRKHPEIERRIKQAQVVEDVMQRKITGGIGNTLGVTYAESNAGKGDTASTSPPQNNKYLPKGNLESGEEYAQRLSMTPFFPETPHIIQDRIGAIFSEAPILDGTDKDEYADFYKCATVDEKSLSAAAADSGAWVQRVGFQGCLIDRKPLTDDVKAKLLAGTLSEAEVSEGKLNDPHLVFYRPGQILDFEYGSGLEWVKLLEVYFERASWDSKPETIKVVRIIDRKKSTAYRIDEKDNVTKGDVLPHEYVDENKKPAVPFVFIHSPIDVWSCLGSTMLQECAEADVSCTRLLSDIVWDLFILGQPILAWWTHTENEKLSTGATRYVKLKPARGNSDPEDLKFIQLDSEGIKMQMSVHEIFKAIGRYSAGRVGDAVVQDAPEQTSGVSRAWEFKTGEERCLFLITFALQAAYDKILKIVALMSGRDPANIKIKFNVRFDMGAPKDSLDVSERVLKIIGGMEMPESRKIALRKVIDALGPRSEEQDSAVEDEITKAAEKPVEIVDPALEENQNADSNQNADKAGNPLPKMPQNKK